MCLNNILSFVLILSILESFIYQKPARPCQMSVSVCVCEREQAWGNITAGHFLNKSQINISLLYLLMYCVVQTL